MSNVAECNTRVEVLVPVNTAVFVSIIASLTAPNTNICLIYIKKAKAQNRSEHILWSLAEH